MKLHDLTKENQKKKIIDFIKKTVKRKIPKATFVAINNDANEVMYKYKNFYVYVAIDDGKFDVSAVDNEKGISVVVKEMESILN